MHMPYKVDGGPTYRRIRQKKTRTRSKARPRPAVKAGARPPAGENLAAALHLAPWRAPTGDTQPKVLVRAGELTCLNCFETFTPGTGANEPGAGSSMRYGGHRGIPTLSYLFEENYLLRRNAPSFSYGDVSRMALLAPLCLLVSICDS